MDSEKMEIEKGIKAVEFFVEKLKENDLDFEKVRDAFVETDFDMAQMFALAGVIMKVAHDVKTLQQVKEAMAVFNTGKEGENK